MCSPNLTSTWSGGGFSELPVMRLDSAMSASCRVLLSSVLTYLCVPHLSPVLPVPPRWDAPHLDSSRMVPLNVGIDGVVVLREVLDELVEEGVQNIVVLYDGDLVSSMQFIKDEAVQDALEASRPTYQMYIVLLQESSSAKLIFQEAQKLDLLSALFNWVLIGFDINVSHDVIPYVNNDINAVYIDVSIQCSKDEDEDWSARETAEECIYQQLQHCRFEQVPNSLCSLSDLLVFLRNATHISRHDYCQPDDEYIQNIQRYVSEHLGVMVWSTEETCMKPMSPVGLWNPDGGRLPTKLVKPFHGLRGRVFNITTVPNKIFQLLQPDGTWKGLAYDILGELMRSLNFSYEVHRPPDGQWGTQEPNGSWNGMIGQIVRKEVDFGVASFTVTSQRAAAVNFTMPIWRGSTALLLATNPAVNYFAYLNPYHPYVLLCILSATVTVTVLLWILAKFHPWEIYGPRNTKRGHGNIHAATLAQIWLRIFGSLFTQEIPWKCHTMSVRFIQGSMLLCNVMLIATYTGNLVSLLTVSTQKAPVDTLYDLVHAEGYQAGLVKGQALVQVLKEAKPDSLYHQLWAKISQDLDQNLVKNLDEGFNKVLSEDFIFMDDTKNLRSSVAETDHPDRCSLHIGREKFFYMYYAFPLQVHSPYLDLFNKRIQSMIESGLVDHWRAKYGGTTGAKNCDQFSNKVQVEANIVTLQHLSGAFILLIVGLMSGALALVVEMSYHYALKKGTFLQNSCRHGLDAIRNWGKLKV